ncbi:MAG: DUF885 domain-containing protein [Flavobacteriales bacterium]|nr:DUF885 domain-containing protein [Flavobacteriales bacterium]
MKNHQLLPLALPFALCFGCSSNDNTATVHPPETAQHRTDSSDAAFMRLADGYFDTYYFPTNPTIATYNGIHTYDSKLEDFSKAGIDANVKALKEWEKKVAAVDSSALSEQVQGDRMLVLNNIRTTLLTLQSIRPWEKNPDFYSSGITTSAFTLMERKFAAPEARLKDLIARERAMPAFLGHAKDNLQDPPKIFTQIALDQLPGLVEFFKNDVPKAFTTVTDDALRKEFTASNDSVIAALQDYMAWLKKDVLPKGNGDFMIGADTYRKKLEYDEMVTTPLDQLIALDTANMHHNQQQFAEVAKQLDPKKTPREVLAELATDGPKPDSLLPAFRATFDHLISFIKDKKIITLPSDVRPILEETPPFMRAITFASMDTPGPYEQNATEAYFNVTLPEKDWTPKHTAEFMAQFSYAVISSVAVHEAYPGHYVQFLWMHKLDDRVRKILGCNTNAEGWAHYCEQMMLDEGLATAMYPNDERQQLELRLGQLQDALLRNARFVVGIKLHTGEMTMDQAIQYFVDEGYQSRAVGEVETKRATSDPTYLYYTLGKLEILKLRKDMEAKQGKDFDLMTFHDNFMKQGFAPIKIVRKAMLGDDSPTL